MRRMGKIVGRTDDMLIIRGVNVFPTQIEELILQHGQLLGPVSAGRHARRQLLDEVRCRASCVPDARSAPTARDRAAGCSTASRR